MFTTATMLKLAYSGFRTNISIDERLRNSETIAMLGGVSAENGLEAFIMRPRSINYKCFLEYFDKVLVLHPPQKVTFFLDSCQVRHSKIV